MEPLQIYIDSGRDVVQQIEKMRDKTHAKLIFYRENPDGLVIKYLINMPMRDKPIFIHSLDQLKLFNESPAYVVTSTSYSDDIEKNLLTQYKKVFMGRMAHVNIIVFESLK